MTATPLAKTADTGYAQRRAQVAKLIGPRGIAIIPTAP